MQNIFKLNNPNNWIDSKIIVVMLFIIAFLFVSGCTQENNSSATTDENTQNQEQTGSQAFSISEVEQHDNEQNCWLAINGKVYDVAAFISGHPGGQAILEGCGKDATELFETRPMGSGTPHSENAHSLLGQYYIGDLA